MSYDPEIHHRRSIRLKEYDYSQDGFYFITICVHGRIPLFGNIVDDVMQMNDAGRMVEKEYLQLPDKYPHVVCHEYVVMPNHFHCIIGISDMDNPVGAPLVGARQMPDYMYAGTHKGCPYGVHPTLGEIMGVFKSITTNTYIHGVKQYGWAPFHTRLWQRNYYEHIIRNQRSYDEISCYILENPIHWRNDKLYYEP